MADRGRVFDIIVIGGGVNGTGIARDAAGRGLKVALFEAADLGQTPASLAAKLVRGEPAALAPRGAARLRAAMAECERLRAIAPQLVSRLECIMPVRNDSAAAWMILARRGGPPATRAVRLALHPAGEMIGPAYAGGFAYADCWVEESRLAVLNAMDAAARGARIYPRTGILDLRRQAGLWRAETAGAAHFARAVVNAAEPPAGELPGGGTGVAQFRLAKGSQIITRRLDGQSHALVLPNPDGRVTFVVPYERAFSLIGATETPYDGEPAAAQVTAAETDYLCASVNRYCRTAITPDDVLWTLAGVGPVFEAAADGGMPAHRLALAGDAGGPPLLSVYGGRVIFHRRLAERALEMLLPAMGRPVGKPWTAGTALPGGDTADFAAFARLFRAFNTHLDAPTAQRLAGAYGTLVKEFVQPNMGHDFGGGLTRAEVDYLVRHEWARTAEDILWRRSKLGLHVPEGTEARLTAYLDRHGR